MLCICVGRYVLQRSGNTTLNYNIILRAYDDNMHLQVCSVLAYVHIKSLCFDIKSVISFLFISSFLGVQHKKSQTCQNRNRGGTQAFPENMFIKN